MAKQNNSYLMPEEVSIMRLLMERGVKYREIAERLPRQELITLEQFNKAIANLRRHELTRFNPLSQCYILSDKGKQYMEDIDKIKNQEK